MGFALFLTLLAGLSTVIGGIIALHKHMSSRKALAVALGFAAGAMLFVSFFEILPKAEVMLASHYAAAAWISIAAFFCGIALVALIDKLIPASFNPSEHEGAEVEDETISKKERKKLLRSGILVAAAIALHNFPEGLVTFIGALEDPTLGIMLAVAIAIHNIPEGIAIGTPIYAATKSKAKAVFYTLLAGIAEPLGALIGFFIIGAVLPENLLGAVFAGVAGMMVFISIDELLPAAKRYETNPHQTIYGCIAGMFMMAMSLALLT